MISLIRPYDIRQSYKAFKLVLVTRACCASRRVFDRPGHSYSYRFILFELRRIDGFLQRTLAVRHPRLYRVDLNRRAWTGAAVKSKTRRRADSHFITPPVGLFDWFSIPSGFRRTPCNLSGDRYHRPRSWALFAALSNATPIAFVLITAYKAAREVRIR
jgi:hypothetical protein